MKICGKSIPYKGWGQELLQKLIIAPEVLTTPSSDSGTEYSTSNAKLISRLSKVNHPSLACSLPSVLKERELREKNW